MFVVVHVVILLSCCHVVVVILFVVVMLWLSFCLLSSCCHVMFLLSCCVMLLCHVFVVLSCYYRVVSLYCCYAGGVMYQTSPDEPAQVVSKLCHRHSSDVVLLGNYQVQDRTVSPTGTWSGITVTHR